MQIDLRIAAVRRGHIAHRALHRRLIARRADHEHRRRAGICRLQRRTGHAGQIAGHAASVRRSGAVQHRRLHVQVHQQALHALRRAQLQHGQRLVRRPLAAAADPPALCKLDVAAGGDAALSAGDGHFAFADALHRALHRAAHRVRQQLLQRRLARALSVGFQRVIRHDVGRGKRVGHGDPDVLRLRPGGLRGHGLQLRGLLIRQRGHLDGDHRHRLLTPKHQRPHIQRMRLNGKALGGKEVLRKRDFTATTACKHAVHLRLVMKVYSFVSLSLL